MTNKTLISMETSGIVVASCSIGDLFSGKPIQASDNTFIKGKLDLPEYQRPYRWREAQVSRLVGDLLSYFKQTKSVPNSDFSFFLGSVILHQQEKGEMLSIIDGQQRLTTMGLLAWMQKRGSEPDLIYKSPISQHQIRQNITWISNQNFPLQLLDLHRINIVLVVTRSEDDAYRFFETQNTGGVRLSGPDIIKAYHLRVTPHDRQDDFARLWEGLGDLNPVVNAALKARYWQALKFRALPSYSRPQMIRSSVVNELAEQTGSAEADISYKLHTVTYKENGVTVLDTQAGSYAIRQPLNAGINTIHYLRYFEFLRQQLFFRNDDEKLEWFHEFYQGLIRTVDGCVYLKDLYDSCLLVYVSHFGRKQLYEFSLWLFRVVYSRRVSNKKTVREESVGAFVRDCPIYDWILSSFTHEQCIKQLKEFKIEVSPENLGPDENSVKKRFIDKVDKWFVLSLPNKQMAQLYDERLKSGIVKKVEAMELSHE
ncbi:MAG: DUF262 domain-containing protein [Janthinobacterium sp.]